MKQHRVILSALLFFSISPALLAANHFKKIDECALVYSNSKAEEPIKIKLGDSFLNIRNMHKMTTKTPGEFTFFYGSNSITIIADAEGQEDIIDSFKDCSEVAD